MNNKNKNSSKRKESHSRQHTSNLRSTSKSNEKSKHRSDSKLLLKLKQPQHSQLNNTDNPTNHAPNTNALSHRITSKKITSNKHVETSNEYYNHYRVKSKSKGKLAGSEEENIKNMYLNSVYMHKEANDPHSVSQNEHLNRNMNQTARTFEKDEVSSHANAQLLQKIRCIEKNGAIDANGKFVVREIRNQHQFRNTDSLQTISIYQGEKKKDRPRRKEKTRKQIKTKNRKEGDGVKAGETSRLGGVRSADKFIKKKDVKDINSPSVLQNHTLRHYQFQTCHAQQARQMRENPYKVGREEIRANPPVLSTRTSKTILSEQTQTSPPQYAENNYALSSMQVNIDYIVKELIEDKGFRLSTAKLKMIYNGGLHIQRVKCIEFLSKLCISLNIRRQSHSLAIFYIDKYLLLARLELNSRQLKLISMTALLLALKVDDGIMSRKMCHEYINHMEIILNMSYKTSSKSKSIMKYKEAISAFSSKDSSAGTIINKSKSQSNISDLGITKGDMKKSRKEETVHTKEMARILSLELDMLMKFSFKLVKRSTTYWIDILTLLWDSYINEEITWQLDLLFRCDKNKRNISHCYQLIEKLSLDLQIYNYSTPLVVLSAMYLIIRMRLEQQKQGQQQQEIYTKYMNNLSKSTNLIFYDNVGINQLFGDFLYEFEMNLSEIIQCIQFVGKNLMVNMKVFSFTSKNQYVNCRSYEHQLSIYEGNSQLYKFVEDQY